MKWSEKLPAEPGWYWIKSRRMQPFIKKYDQELVDEMKVDPSYTEIVASGAFRFCGPLQPPQEEENLP